MAGNKVEWLAENTEIAIYPLNKFREITDLSQSYIFYNLGESSGRKDRFEPDT